MLRVHSKVLLITKRYRQVVQQGKSLLSYATFCILVMTRGCKTIPLAHLSNVVERRKLHMTSVEIFALEYCESEKSKCFSSCTCCDVSSSLCEVGLYNAEGREEA